MTALLDMTVPIGGAGGVTTVAAIGIPGDGSTVGDSAAETERGALPWAMVDDQVGPLWSYVRGARRMVEVAACTRAGDRRRHANQDAAIVQVLPGGSLIVAVLDGISGSVGVDVGQFRNKLVDDFGLLVASGLVRPLELMHRLDREARRWLGRVAPDAATGAAMIVVHIDIDSGRADWASAGDIRLLTFNAGRRAWLGLARRWRARVLNTPAKSTASNRLTAAVGQWPPLRIEAGSVALVPGQMLVLSTDGGTAPLEATCDALQAFAAGDRFAGLEALVNRLDRLAIEFANGNDDDRTTVALSLGRQP